MNNDIINAQIIHKFLNFSESDFLPAGRILVNITCTYNIRHFVITHQFFPIATSNFFRSSNCSKLSCNHFLKSKQTKQTNSVGEKSGSPLNVTYVYFWDISKKHIILHNYVTLCTSE